MADITNAQAIRFVNDEIRQIAEQMRAMKARIDAAIVTWYGGLNTLIPNDSSPVADGRESEGVSRLLGSDVNNLVTQMVLYQTQLDGEGVPGVISKPCVRGLDVS